LRVRLSAASSVAGTRQKASTTKKAPRSANFVKTLSLKIKPNPLFILLFLIGAFSIVNLALAHGAEPSLSDKIVETSKSVVTISSILIILLVLMAVGRLGKEAGEGNNFFKGVIFFPIVIIVLGATFYLSASTIYLNMVSETGGPVHWHADFRIFKCGQELFLEEPTGLSNRIGKSDLHEHGDGRIHIEGVVVKRGDFSLHKFFEAINGNLTAKELSFPGKNTFEKMVAGEPCPGDLGESEVGPTQIQVFLYKTEGDTIRQSKLENFEGYVPSPYSQIPPGDCIIFEYGPEIKNRTENICNFTEIGIKEGKYKYLPAGRQVKNNYGN